MKKLLAILPAATFALTGCLSSSDNSATSASPVPPPLPVDFIVTEMGEYSYAADGALEITKATCKDYANEVVWKKTTQTGSLTDNGDNTAKINLGDGSGYNTYKFASLAGERFPVGSFYKTSTINNPLVEGLILEDPYYSEVIFVNTQCLFQNFGEMQETMSQIAKVPKSSVTMECNKVSIQGLTMTYVSHTETSIDYTLSYAGKSCSMKHNFLYAYNRDDCSKAFANYQQEYANGETQDFFNFDLYDQDITASAECIDVLGDFHNATGLAKSGASSALSEKQVKDILRALGSRIRHGK